jgi:protein ImuA
LLSGLHARLQALQPRAAHGVLPFGDPRIDANFAEGGLALGNLHEIAGRGIEAQTGAVAAGFAACLLAGVLARLPQGRPAFWIATRCDLHAPGLLPYGLDPGAVIQVHARNDDEALAAMEAALRGGAAGVVLAEVGKLGRTASRRLQLSCLKHGTTGFVLRRWPHGQRAASWESTVCVTRWQVAPAPSEVLFREPGAACWQVELTHARGGREGAWIVQAGDTANAHSLRVVAELADAAPATDRRRRAG